MSHTTVVADPSTGMKTAARTITIDPVTRLEGHGKISIFLDDNGEVERAYFQVPELRGFEKFVQGRPAEEMPQITSRICGVCPMAHHMAATKALDDLYHVKPPEAARKARELAYLAFIVEDHLLHFYFLGGPDFIVGPDRPPAERNILGVMNVLGLEAGRRVIAVRNSLREVISEIAGKSIHPVFGLPGGIAKPVSKGTQRRAITVAEDALDFAQVTLAIFEEKLLPRYLETIQSDAYSHATYYMGMVDDSNRLNFYEGKVRVVAPSGQEWTRFEPRDYVNVIAEHVEPWTFVKFCYLKPIGWRGFEEGAESGVYSVAPLARLNVANELATPLAQHAAQRYFATMGGRPVHNTLANHWARLIEVLYAAERMKEIAEDEAVTDPHVREIPKEKPTEGVGIVEAPRGTLIHHYETDDRGLITKANLIVATQNNAARIAMSVDKAAKSLIHGGVVSDGLLNRIEMAFRAYDPCNGCATHALGISSLITVELRDCTGHLIGHIFRDQDGGVRLST